MGLVEKMRAGTPKKMLALDGGGVRGIISIEILAAIERAVGQPLADYFDYVGGTSTGAILAAAISLGMPVDEIRRFYLEASPSMFAKASPFRRFYYKYDDVGLATILKRAFAAASSPKGEVTGEVTGEITLGSAAIKTLLLMVLRNATTDSPWPLSNNPRAKYNDRAREDCNLDIPLWRLVRASTAAPTYFQPETVRVGPREFLFVDGGVTPYNHPGFLLFLQATLEPYRLCWPTGPDKLLIVSVGTGAVANANAALRARDMNLFYNAGSVPSALIYAGLNHQDMLCRVFGRCLHGAELDSEIGDLRWSAADPISALPKLFTYLRYTTDLSRSGLTGLGFPTVRPEHVQRLDSVEHLADLQRIGQAAGREVRGEHFAGFLP